MRTKALVAIATLATGVPVAAWTINARLTAAEARPSPPVAAAGLDHLVDARTRADFDGMRSFRPGFAFWRYVFTIPDGRIVFGSALDGRLLVTFPANGDWTRNARWADPALADLLHGEQLARKVSERREQVALLLERAVGPVIHNSTRGDALLQNVQRYGPFLAEWSAIFQRFGVPPDIGLAQVILESGMNGTKRSEKSAVGFCQWMPANWKHLNYLSETPIEGQNQTTQAPYCAAYLSVLATKYGSFIPALSEHNAGGTNVGRTLINGEFLGADDVRARYFAGSKLAHDLRSLPGRQFTSVYRTYGPRSHLYAEMVFGNTYNVRSLIASVPQMPIFAMRLPRAMSLAEIVRQTGLPADEVRRFNPALVDRVPAQATLYFPYYVPAFGPDVAFWHRPPSPSYAAVLDDFVHLEAGPEQWDDPSFAPVLKQFQRRFRETKTEEGAVMETVLAYAMDEAYTSPRRSLLAEFRRSEDVLRLIESGVIEPANPPIRLANSGGE